MKNFTPTRHKALDELVFNYILLRIPSSESIKEGWDIEATTDRERLQFMFNCFKSESYFPENITRYGSAQNVMKEWFMGLPSAINVDFENYRIIEIAKEWGSIPEDATDLQVYKILENWFNFIAAKTLKLCKKNKIQ